jgi:hypothetical protein
MKQLTSALSIITLILAAWNAVKAQSPAQPAPASDAVRSIPAEAKIYVGTFRFKTSVAEGAFWISYDGAGLKLDRFRYKDARGERDLQGVSIVKAEEGSGYTIVGKTWRIKNLVPDKDGKVLLGDFEQGAVHNRVLYWREKE